MKTIFVILCLSAVGLSGCATAQEVTDDNGNSELKITCSLGIACEEKAKDLCDGNYQIIRATQGLTSSKNEIFVKCIK